MLKISEEIPHKVSVDTSWWRGMEIVTYFTSDSSWYVLICIMCVDLVVPNVGEAQ